MTHREELIRMLGDVTLVGKSIFDWGSGTKPVEKYIQHTDCTFYTFDKRKDLLPTYVADIAKPVYVDHLADAAFCMEVLEHVEFPDVALQNIHRHLKVGSPLYLSVPFRYPLHSGEDYWRFTELGIKLLLERNGFGNVDVYPTTEDLGFFVIAKSL